MNPRKKKRILSKTLFRVIALALFVTMLGGSIFALNLTDRYRRDQSDIHNVDLVNPFAPNDGSGNTASTTGSDTTGGAEAGSTSTGTSQTSEPQGKPFMTETFADYAAVAAYLEQRGAMTDYSLYKNEVTTGTADSGAVASTEAAAEAPAADTATGSGGNGGYSETNTQETDVDEADIIKTDGNYIYYLNQSAGIAIVKASGASMSRAALIKADENESFTDMYLYGDKLIAVGFRWVNASDSEWWRGTNYTVFSVYNIADRNNPVLERKAQVEGYTITTRLMNGVLYYVTNKDMYGVPVEYKNSDLVPKFYDTLAGNGEQLIAADSIGYTGDSSDLNYLVVGGMDLDNPAPLSPNACLGSGLTVYMSGEGNIYVTRWDYSDDATSTFISKFSTDRAAVWFAGEAKIDGNVINQYAMDEYEGNLRVAATANDWSSGNNNSSSAMYVFDAAMNKIGYIGGIAPGEQIQSVRFMDGTAYMVTFENMDPLFVIDMTSPTAPVIKGQLKIPGFSEYLHPFGSDYLIGIGRETTETYIKDEMGNEQVVGYRDMGLKVSLFDVSDIMNPKEIAKLKLGGESSYTDATYNPKSIMVDFTESESEATGPDVNGILAFPMYFDAGTGNYDDNDYCGIVLSVNPGKGFEIKTKVENNSDYNYSGSSRFCYIGNTLYYADGMGITATDYTTFQRLGYAAIYTETDFPVYDDDYGVMPAQAAVME